jgi:hypothetical protein
MRYKFLAFLERRIIFICVDEDMDKKWNCGPSVLSVCVCDTG